MTIALWSVQGLVALIFLLSGFLHGFVPMAGLKKNVAWVENVPAGLVRFIGIAEILGALGLIVPTLTKMHPEVTLAAAGGLALVMLCAAVFHATRKEYRSIGVNIVLLLLAAFIAVGYLIWIPIV